MCIPSLTPPWLDKCEYTQPNLLYAAQLEFKGNQITRIMKDKANEACITISMRCSQWEKVTLFLFTIKYKQLSVRPLIRAFFCFSFSWY